MPQLLRLENIVSTSEDKAFWAIRKSCSFHKVVSLLLRVLCLKKFLLKYLHRLNHFFVQFTEHYILCFENSLSGF